LGIGRITTSGVITEYTVLTAVSYPIGITAGPDGALWFTEYYGNNIGRAPACGLGFSASFTNGTLTMNFDLGISTPATWYANVTSAAGTKQLWSKPIPAVIPPTPLTLMFGPDFPDEGNVTIVSGLQTAPNEGLCYETAAVNTGP